ncbi:hypothetical protein COY32_00845 [candidate division WWE3 bacterium CG_4_10_14_0_2_um_filter_41_14]|uniref:DUF2933 domain-containing protein n=1 Tax=candidate division WWE3 bacterium CG_4_10_14_0_2_um_filter_41_14 TaxID=1975072 RepID=A0A2M7TLH6_UNCKA|nr:MAG: hypothetical protein COY32_00845 [candidate division WWE3 bacterium CG_4_10_14_0_2_um_filter_41_14]
MKHTNHLVICLVLIGITGLAYLFIPQVQSLGWFGVIILTCLVMHIFMTSGEHGRTMQDSNHKH